MQLSQLKGVGPRLGHALQRYLASDLVSALLLIPPLRFEDHTKSRLLAHAPLEQDCLVEGVIVDQQLLPNQRLRCVIHDQANDSLELCFFRAAPYLRHALKTGQAIRCFGKLTRFRSQWQMNHPQFHVAKTAAALPPRANYLTPIYPLGHGISQRNLANAMAQALGDMDDLKDLQEPLTPTQLQQHQLADLPSAIKRLHQRGTLEDFCQRHRRRLALHELLQLLQPLRQRRHWLRQQTAFACTTTELVQQFIHQLPFELTADQQQVIGQISQQVANPYPTMQLVQGDVGSGKTVVAAAVAVQMMAHGVQVALMAPTELLAEQHLRCFSQWLTPLGITTVGLLGNQTRRQRRQALDQIASGQGLMVVGTHALYQESVKFQQLGLVIIDEQHRFGVEQRLELARKSRQVAHQLVMSATPIPRTLARTVYADLDVARIRTMPQGRKAIITAVANQDKRPQVIERLRQAVAQQRQAYWICPLVEDSEQIDASSATDTWQALVAQLPQCRIGLVHGRLKSEDKQQQLDQFSNHQLDILVATTVVEVGVDVPNATVMVIDNAERLGLAQLHQLRGRVGRGSQQSHCLLLYQGPLSAIAQQRLQAIRNSNDGFQLAEQDLQIRGQGDLEGLRQSGLPLWRFVDIHEDQDLLNLASELSDQWVEAKALEQH